jgi:hypothetical protein
MTCLWPVRFVVRDDLQHLGGVLFVAGLRYEALVRRCRECPDLAVYPGWQPEWRWLLHAVASVDVGDGIEHIERVTQPVRSPGEPTISYFDQAGGNEPRQNPLSHVALGHTCRLRDAAVAQPHSHLGMGRGPE